MWMKTSHSESARPASSTRTEVDGIGGEAVGQHAAGRAAADDHEVVAVAHGM